MNKKNLSNSAKLTLGDVLRENASKRPAASTSRGIQWELVLGGIRPLHREPADCLGSEPESDNSCHNRPVWVVETYDGYYPTCLEHSGKVLNRLLPTHSEDLAETAMYFHPYKGA
jgi:hypothetical protein